jgi:protein O-mannosyl-transferase
MGRKSRAKKLRPPEVHPRERQEQRAAGRTNAASPHRGPYHLLAVSVFLLLAVLAVFGQTIGHDFVNFDDDVYVYENPQVNGGLTSAGTAWAITAFHSNNWHPLTWLSHMLDCQLYGLKPGGHHVSNVLLHAASAILLFLALQRLTGAFWPSAWVAAIFALHPLRVESVAWVAERKDVLSGLFFMLTLWFYARYVERPASWGRYSLVLAAFALGLTAKPMLVTLPFVLLLLDYWPLGRFGPRREAKVRLRLVVEKIPLFVLAAASCAVTLAAQRDAIAPLEQLAVSRRLANAAVVYVAYLGKMFYPADLAVLYPFPNEPPPAWEVAAAVSLLLAISIAVFVVRRNCPYLLFGWLWYLGTLAPVIGVVQVGSQMMADRYTYLPQIGLYVAIAWGAAHLASRELSRQRWLAVVGALAVAGLMGRTWEQTRHWRDSETLWVHTLSCTPSNARAEYNLGHFLAGRGRVNDAIPHFRSALESQPRLAKAHIGLGLALVDREQVDEAVDHFRKALDVLPDSLAAHFGLGNALVRQGQFDEAITQFRAALAINLDYAEAHNNLGEVLARRRRVDEAITQFRAALAIKPDYAVARSNLGQVLAGRGQLDEAIAEYRKALAIKPNSAEIHYNLGSALADRRQIDEAITEYRKALAIKPGYAEAHNNLGTALAGAGQVDAAVAHFRAALESKPGYFEAHNNLGNALNSLKQVNEAIAEYQKALAINPDYIDAHLNLGLALVGSGRIDEALEQYHKALEIASARNDRVLADKIQARINATRP